MSRPRIPKEKEEKVVEMLLAGATPYRIQKELGSCQKYNHTDHVGAWNAKQTGKRGREIQSGKKRTEILEKFAE